MCVTALLQTLVISRPYPYITGTPSNMKLIRGPAAAKCSNSLKMAIHSGVVCRVNITQAKKIQFREQDDVSYVLVKHSWANDFKALQLLHCLPSDEKSVLLPSPLVVTLKNTKFVS